MTRYAKYSNLSRNRGITKTELEQYVTDVDFDIKNLFLQQQGRITFGDSTSGEPGNNIAGEFQQFTTDATPDTEFAVAHTLDVIPKGFLTLWQDKAGSLYQGPTTGTAWTSSNVYLKCDVASVEFNIFLLK